MACDRPIQRFRPAAVAGLLAGLLLALLGLPPAGLGSAAAQVPEGRFLTPAPETRFDDGTLLAVAWNPDELDPDLEASVEFAVVHQPGPLEQERVELGTDEDGVIPTRGPACAFSTCEQGQVWSVFWDLGPDDLGGAVRLEATGVLCGEGLPCVRTLLDSVDGYVLFPQQARWEFGGLRPVFGPGPVDLRFDFGLREGLEADAEELSVDLTVLRAAHDAALPDGKDLPLIDQHSAGDELSGDVDDDGRQGDMSCAPTAAASSLAWFAENEEAFAGIVPEGQSAEDLVQSLGEDAGTDDNGTADPNLADAIRRHLDEVGLGDAFEVVVTGDMNTPQQRADDADESPSLDQLRTEFARGQDVLVAFVSDDGTTNHMMAVEQLVPSDGEGPTTVRVMDPLTGEYTTVTVSDDGDATYDGRDGWIDALLHVSPVDEPSGDEVAADVEANAAASGDTAAFQQTSFSVTGTWDGSGAAPGRYLARGTVRTPDDETFTTYQLFEITPGDQAVRLAGSDRIATSLAVSRDRFADGGADTVVLARHDAFPDALAGTPLAIQRSAPLLLTPTDSLDQRVEDEIVRLMPETGTVVLLGGEAALSPAVSSRLAGLGYDLERLGGADRFETAVAIARDGLGDPATLLLATGFEFADALAGGAAAGAIDAAVLLTAGSSMPPATQAYMDARTGVDRFALGGPAARAAPGATPILGLTRFETAVAVANEFLSGPLVVGVATGLRFPDALTGGAHVGQLGGPMLLTPPDTLHPAVADYLELNAQTVFTAYLYGGQAALSDAVETAVQAAIG